MMGSQKLQGSRWGAYALVCLTHTLMHAFTQMHIALIPVLRVELGLDILTIGLVASVPTVVNALFTIPGGLLADRADRSKMIAAGLLISGVGGALMTQANSATTLVAFVSMFSIASTLLHPPALSTVSELVEPRLRGKALGFFGSAGTLDIALGPITLSILLGIIGWRYVYLLWAIPALVAPVLILRLRLDRAEEPSESQSGNKARDLHMLRNLSLVLVLAILGARAMGGNAINTYITPYFTDWLKLEAATAILIFGMSPLIGAVASTTGGFMVDRFGEKRWFAIGFLSQIVALLALAFSTNIGFAVVAYLSYAFFGSMEMPAEQSLIAKLTPRSGRGLAFALSFLPGTIAGSFSHILVAFVVEGLGIWYIFPYAVAMFAAAIAMLGLLWKRV
ncbi:MFS transporter [Candidatus Bathyarchaeota archaeon]|nr:MFS transporter [Candidatus Bathyarchaeota archaeon]